MACSITRTLVNLVLLSSALSNELSLSQKSLTAVQEVSSLDKLLQEARHARRSGTAKRFGVSVIGIPDEQ
jgi:hypothetical protein